MGPIIKKMETNIKEKITINISIKINKIMNSKKN